MTEEQFAIWLMGYLEVNVFQRNMGPTSSSRAFEVAKVGADVLATARSVVSSTPPETGS